MSFWLSPEQCSEFEAAYARYLVPLLTAHGLVHGLRRLRPGVKGVFSRLIEVDTPAAILAHERALLRDPAWQAALYELGPLFGAGPSLPFYFGAHSTSTLVPSCEDILPDLDHWHAVVVGLDHREEFIGESPALQQFQARLAQAAATDLPVLIQGAPGTGKHLAALTLHAWSPRAPALFLPVLLQHQAPDQQEPVVFGTGPARLGCCYLAGQGTLFLDELGYLAPHLQEKLLRLLVARTYERGNGSRVLPFYGRVVVATNRDLEQRVEAGTLGADLYAQLQRCRVQVPALRERREDILLLAYYFLSKTAVHLGKPIPRLSHEVERWLKGYEWPLHVRELKELMWQAVVCCTGAVVRMADVRLPASIAGQRQPPQGHSLVELEAQHLRAVLERTRGVLAGGTGAAALLGMPESAVRARMATLGVWRQ